MYAYSTYRWCQPRLIRINCHNQIVITVVWMTRLVLQVQIYIWSSIFQGKAQWFVLIIHPLLSYCGQWIKTQGPCHWNSSKDWDPKSLHTTCCVWGVRGRCDPGHSHTLNASEPQRLFTDLPKHFLSHTLLTFPLAPTLLYLHISTHRVHVNKTPKE